MPTIPGYSSQNAFSGQISPNISINDQGIKAGLQQGVQTLEQYALRKDKLAANSAKNRVAESLAKEQRQLQSEWTPDSGDDLLAQTQEAYTRIVDDELTNAPNARVRNMMANRFGDMQAAHQMKDQEFVFVSQQKEAGRQYGLEKNQMANEAYTGAHPETVLSRSAESAEELQLPANLSAIVDKQADPKIYNAWFAGQIDRADRSIDELKSVKKSVNLRKHDSKLLESDRIQLNKAIDSRIRSLQGQAKQQFTTMFDDALISIAAGGDTNQLPTEEELNAAITEMATLPNSDAHVRDLKIKKSAIDQTRGYADMTAEQVREHGIALQGDFTHLSAGSTAKTADAIRARELVGTINGDYQKAWVSDPHHMHDQYSNGRYNDVDLSSAEGFSQTIVERRASRDDIEDIHGIPAPLFRPQDYHQAGQLWDSKDSASRASLIRLSQQAMPLVTPENREAMAEWAMGVTDDPIMAAAFLSPDPSAFATLTAGKGIADILKSVDGKSWGQIREYGLYDLMGQYHEDSDKKSVMVDVLAHYVAGQLSLRDGKVGKPSSEELKSMYDNAVEALFGTRVELNGHTAFIPHDRQGNLIPKSTIVESLYGLSDEGIIAATGGLYDDQGVLMPDQQFAIRSGSFKIRAQGVILEGQYEDSVRDGFYFGADGEPLAFDFEKIAKTYNNPENRQFPEDIELPYHIRAKRGF